MNTSTFILLLSSLMLFSCNTREVPQTNQQTFLEDSYAMLLQYEKTEQAKIPQDFIAESIPHIIEYANALEKEAENLEPICKQQILEAVTQIRTDAKRAFIQMDKELGKSSTHYKSAINKINTTNTKLEQCYFNTKVKKARSEVRKIVLN